MQRILPSLAPLVVLAAAVPGCCRHEPCRGTPAAGSIELSAAPPAPAPRTNGVINLLVDCTHDYSFHLSNAGRTQSEIFPGITCLTSGRTIHKADLGPVNALVVLLDGKLPYAKEDAPHILDYVARGGGVYLGLAEGGQYAESMAEFLAGFGLRDAGPRLSQDPRDRGVAEHVADAPRARPRAGHPAALPEAAFALSGRIPNIQPLDPEAWETIYAGEDGTAVVRARRHGHGILVADATRLYHGAIAKSEPAVAAMRRLLEYMSAGKNVEPMEGGGGWQFSEGYRWDRVESTADGLRIHHNEYSRMYIANDVRAYRATVRYLRQISGLDEKQKAAQIGERNQRRAALQMGAAIDVDITGVQELTLVTTDGGDDIHSDHSIWADARLLDASGTASKLLLADASVVAPGYGKATQDTLEDGKPFSIGGKVFETGIFLHANGRMVFPVAGKYVRFQSWVGCNDAGWGSVGFRVIGDGRTLWDDGRVYLAGVPGGNPKDVNYVPEGVLFQLKYLACVGSGFLLPQGAAVDLPPALKDDWQVHLGMLAHEMGHAWSYPFCETLGEEASAFIFNNLVLHRHHGQKHGDSVTRRLLNYLKDDTLDAVDLAAKGHNQKYYLFIDLMIREYGEDIWRNYNLLKYALLNKPGAVWSPHTAAWLWSIAAGRDVFPDLQTAFGTSVAKERVQLPAEAMAAGFDPVAVGRIGGVPLVRLPRQREILGAMRNFADVRTFYAAEAAAKGHPEHEG